jgi:hypothetical protein
VEAIEHDALETGRSSDLLGDDVREVGQRARPLHSQNRGAEWVVDRLLLRHLWVWLELEDRGILMAVNDPIE